MGWSGVRDGVHAALTGTGDVCPVRRPSSERQVVGRRRTLRSRRRRSRHRARRDAPETGLPARRLPQVPCALGSGREDELDLEVQRVVLFPGWRSDDDESLRRRTDGLRRRVGPGRGRSSRLRSGGEGGPRCGRSGSEDGVASIGEG